MFIIFFKTTPLYSFTKSSQKIVSLPCIPNVLPSSCLANPIFTSKLQPPSLGYSPSPCKRGQIGCSLNLNKAGNVPPFLLQQVPFPFSSRSPPKTAGVRFFGCWDERMVVITFIQKMGRKRIKGTKYNRVTKQQKYVFLKLCITQKQSIHEAAFNAGIHYSTAKTILFFHKKQYKNYSTYIVEDPHAHPFPTTAITATWREIPIDVDQEHTEPSRIELVINSKKKMLEERAKMKEKGESTSEGKDSQGLGVKMQDADLLFFLRHQKKGSEGEQMPCNNCVKGEEVAQLPKEECPFNFFY